jgi:asparagine synthase (glutamine-hydrolysing)
MEGMWAIALWDTEGQKLLLARDRMGKKPLYFDITHGGFACASELPALRMLVAHPWHEDEDSTADYLRYGYCLPGHTAYREVQEVLPGHIAYWRTGEAQRTSAIVLGADPRQICRAPQATQRNALHSTLTEAVRLRMVADVDVGAFLSGGVDSSLICAIVRQELKEPLKSFTIGFADKAFDERQYAKLVAKTLGTEHFEEVLPGWDEAELQRLLIEHLGQPFADSSLLPTALVSSAAARHVKVALSGDGGDEFFSGYQRYQARTLQRWYSRLPAGLRKLAEKSIRALPEPTAHHSRSLLKKAHLFIDILERETIESPYVAPTMFAPPDFLALAPDLNGRGHPAPKLPTETSLDDIGRMMHADACIYLPQDILVKVDRASMAHSLEARAPFLDSNLVNLAFSLPTHWHRHGLSGKRMLRKAFSRSLPNSVWNRRKQGFGVPIHSWFRGTLNEQLLALAQHERGLLSANAIAKLLKEHVELGRDHGHRLWTVFAYLFWKNNQL